MFPLAIAAVAGAVGGAVSWLASQEARQRIRTISAALAGGWRMFGLGLLFAYVGVFAAGVVQPDEAVAALTPSTARYYRAVFDRPGWGAVVLAHHLALTPNEAVWVARAVDRRVRRRVGWPEPRRPVLRAVPARARERGPAHRRRPAGSGQVRISTSAGRPPAYFLFLLVPALATALGGRAAAARARLSGRAAMPVGAAAGVPFAILVFAGSVLASVTIAYGSTFVEGSGGSIRIGPEPFGATVLALMWGVAGGAIGAASAGWPRSRRAGSRRDPW